MAQLAGQVAIVTGGTRGLGFAIASEYAAEGATVVAASLSGKPPSDAPPITGPGQMVFDQVDVTDHQSLQRLARRAVDDHGRLDILVANAGVNRNAKAAELSARDWNEMLATNVTGTLYAIQAVVPHLRERGGRIITVSSSMATRPTRGTAGYAATKAAIETLTQVAALELGREGILVNCLAPGVLDVGMGDQLVGSKVWATYVKHFALGRAGAAREAARLAVVLAGPDSTYVNGAVIPVNGGLSWA